MPQLVEGPTLITAAGHPPKRIEEFVGRVNSGTEMVSVARMTSPAEWAEPSQRPEFTVITLVIEGAVHVTHDGGTMIVSAGQAVVTEPGEKVQYSTPDGAQYIAICLPAFSPAHVHRDNS